MKTSESTLRTFMPGQPLPEDAVDLFGDEVEDRFRAAAPGDGATPEAVVIASVGEGEWMGGVYLLIDRENGETVASIRQLVIRPAYRGRGLAGWLLRKAHTTAAELGAARIRSTAGWGCPDHMAMYDRLGYERARGQAPYLVSKPL